MRLLKRGAADALTVLEECFELRYGLAHHLPLLGALLLTLQATEESPLFGWVLADERVTLAGWQGELIPPHPASNGQQQVQAQQCSYSSHGVSPFRFLQHRSSSDQSCRMSQPRKSCRCLESHDSIATGCEPVHPRGQPISHSTNLGLSEREGVRLHVPRHPAAPPDRVAQLR